jgi:putative transposase
MLADLLSESYDADLEESWENERTANALTGVAVRLHQIGCSLRETTTILAELGLSVLTVRSRTGYIGWLIADAPRRRHRCRGSCI